MALFELKSQLNDVTFYKSIYFTKNIFEYDIFEYGSW